MKEPSFSQQEYRERVEQNHATIRRNDERIECVARVLRALREANPRREDGAFSLRYHEAGPCVVLVADDDDNDFWLVQYAFNKLGLKHRLMRAEDGLEAMNYLRGAGEFGDRARFPVADLLLLDLQMPNLDGFGVLNDLRSEGGFFKPPVVVLSASDEKENREKAMGLGAADFFGKPFGSEKMQVIVRKICDKWLGGGCARREGEEARAAA